MPGENESKTSVSDIANMLLTPVQPEDNAVSDEGVEDAEIDSPLEGSEDDLTTDETADDAGQEQATEETEETASEDDADEEEEEQDQDQTVFEIRDEDTIEVMVDGKLENWTIADLKKAASGAGAIEKRLQEATELRKTAHAERTTTLETLAAQERIVANSLAALEETLFKAVIPAPSAKLKETNPAGYLRHKEAYDEDQARIAAARKAVQGKVNEFATQRQQRLKEYGEAAAKQIAQLIPELVDPKTSSTVLEKMVNTAKAYGYTEQEVSAALDPRMFHLVRDAMKYRELTARAKETKVTDLSKQSAKSAPRKLRSGNTKATTVVAAKAKAQAQAKETARTTGKVSDVARTLLVSKR